MLNKVEILSKIHDLGILSVIRGPTPEITLRMVDALVAGGVKGIEITYSTPNAVGTVSLLHEEFGDEILLGMGTLTLPEQPAEAKSAGASFIVSPHCEIELAQSMARSGLLVIIGAFTPSEVMLARKLGADVVKIFPGSTGGAGHLKALRGPFSDLLAIPTGGVDLDNIQQWFDAGALAVGAGSALCPAAWAKDGRFEEITERARAFVEAVARARQLQQ